MEGAFRFVSFFSGSYHLQDSNAMRVGEREAEAKRIRHRRQHKKPLDIDAKELSII